jgi:uncharacterized repeat protein (TIGR03806 family)
VIRSGLSCLAWLALVSASAPVPVSVDVITSDALPPHLSDYHFFRDPAARLPNSGVMPYALNTPLFSDYTQKFRFVFVPEGRKASYRPDGIFEFPVGSALIKSFGYPTDFRVADAPVKLIETRVLLRRASGWVALPYVWNADGTDAELKRAGKRAEVSWIHSDGAARTISYSVPNANQCKECHALNGVMTPIGPKARNLNDGVQLQNWVKVRQLDTLPATAPAVPRWDDVHAPLAGRARAYLDVNCGHCHNRAGAASNTGLFLTWGETDRVAQGLRKTPTAAGRGSGNLFYDIDPGAPEKSILIFRMTKTEPGVAMPELGRATVHTEGVALLTAWIAAMPKEPRQ